MDTILNSLDAAFSKLDSRSRQLLSLLAEDELFRRADGATTSLNPFSCGECILRSAATVEQTFGGITTRLWDDPFEWTLPEKLSTRGAILGYLDEVEATRRKGFSFFASDADLTREIPAPEHLSPLADVLVGTILDASQLQGRAYAIFQTVTGRRPPRL
jgi:hypothetical protein